MIIEERPGAESRLIYGVARHRGLEMGIIERRGIIEWCSLFVQRAALGSRSLLWFRFLPGLAYRQSICRGLSQVQPDADARIGTWRTIAVRELDATTLKLIQERRKQMRCISWRTQFDDFLYRAML